jgi:serine phosphatase RsbU (regulator of sigma subunit)
MTDTRGLTSRLPLKVLTPVALVLPVIVVVLLIGTVAWVQGRGMARSLETRGVEQVHGRIADRLHALLDGPVRWNQLAAHAIRSGAFDGDDLRSWRQPIFEQHRAFSPTLAGLCWGNERGEAVWVFRYPGRAHWEFGIADGQTGGHVEEYPLTDAGKLRGERTGRYEYDPRERPWYAVGVAAGEAGAWGEPYGWVQTDGQAVTLGLPFAAAVMDEQGNRRGVLSAELSLADLASFLKTLKIGQTGLAVIVDERGRLVASSTGAKLATDELERIDALASDDPEVRAVARAFRGAFAGQGQSFPGRWSGEVELDRGEALLTVTTFRRGDGLDWRILTAVPSADFTGEVVDIRRRALRVAAVAVGLTLLLGLLLAAWLARPVLRLRDHARQVGAGDLEASLSLNQARELVELSGELNQMTAGLRERMAMQRSLEMASQVQQALLPAGDPELPGFDVVGHCRYCDQTGGDYYDFLGDAETHEHGAAVVIGDVMGHGVAAAMLMATARGVLRSRSQSGANLGELLNHLNRMLVQANRSGKFMTMLIANLDPASRALRWASAGHDPPILYRPDTDTFHEPDPGSGGGLPLGVMAEEDYVPAAPEPLPPGTVVFLATDGMWETRNPEGEMHGKDRLRDSIRRHASKSAAEIRDGILDDLHAFRGDHPPDDDETFVVIKSIV